MRLKGHVTCIRNYKYIQISVWTPKERDHLRDLSIDGKALLLLLLLLLIILTANGFLPGGSGNKIRHKKQITHITQNNTTIKRNTAHKTTHTMKDTLHRMNTNNHKYLILKLFLNWMRVCRLGYCSSRQGPIHCPWEQIDEFLSSRKRREFVDELSNYQFLEITPLHEVSCSCFSTESF
jgi:hypothetical protein